jgi:outer membrane protein TolC
MIGFPVLLLCRTRSYVASAAVLLLAGCASVDIEQYVNRTNQDATSFTQGHLKFAQTDAQRIELQSTAGQLLSKPLTQDSAVQVALINSPALQALIAQRWSDASAAAQSGRIPNPVLTLERLRTPLETDIGRMLAVGLLDVLTLPQRGRVAQSREAHIQLQLTSDIVEQATKVRQAWVMAVADQQSLAYAKQVLDSAEASAELVRRMFAVGNFTKLQRARQQAFYADAAAQLANAAHTATASREALIRLLGLTDSQALQLKLPDRLADIPATPRAPEDVSKAASEGRLDIRIAQATLDTAAKTQGLNSIASVTDIELSVIRNTAIERDGGQRTQARGAEIAIKLPLFDWGDAQRSAMNAQTLAAAHRLEAVLRAAGSNLRESYSAYRTAYDISRHYRDEIVPLRKQIAEENVLLYNGMIIGVFELLADSRDQIASVIAAINAQKQFWLADAALEAATIGKPMMVQIDAGAAPSKMSGGDAH